MITPAEDTYQNIAKVVRKALALDEDTELKLETGLAPLGTEPEDIAVICHELGIPYMNYVIEGNIITDEGRAELFKLSKANEVIPERYYHLIELAKSRSVREFIKKANLQDLVDLRSYYNPQ